ncbi:uncharacterized protein LOC141599422 [Silene latifolia]|uniref:uncharacterized protein LOC141599422 n=1 Tax=Silene latifolia TaxID=37657 RepID=UPI003D7806CA
MTLFRGSLKLHRFLQSTSANPQAFSLFRHFSTGNEQQQQQQTQDPSSKFDPFRSPPSQGLTYGKLWGINESTLKTDIINLFEGCGLTLDDIKVEYDRWFNPLAMLLQFPSPSAFNAAVKEKSRKGRLLKLDKAERQQWDDVPNNGHYVVLFGIPQDANFGDVERFLSGCNYISSSLEVFWRGASPRPIRVATVGFPSQIEAMNTIIQKNGSFCCNSRIVTRFLQ